MKKGVLIVHGFGGNMEEVKELAVYLEQRGFLVSTPLLPGHCSDGGRLAPASRRQWIEAVERSFDDLALQCERVYLVGFSMGGLLGVHILDGEDRTGRRQEERLGGFVTVNTPFFYWNWKQIFLRLFREWKGSRMRTEDQNGFGSSFERYFSCIRKIPPQAALQFQMLLSSSKKRYQRIHCPALVLQTADDDTVWPVSADIILNRMRGPRAMMKFPQGGHQVFLSPWAAQTCQAIHRFFMEVENGLYKGDSGR